ncbi:hypothetical protein KI688_004604 [Linnemannia hyalina]|uniref:Uncharacterized protein n=1 Tax=Linnemannia hyalina TaxID=64524 RepID=A0A9P7XLR0_9FUNG|nr:hypothetical protein KI688_004604 [Linnemannia hyalina]
MKLSLTALILSAISAAVLATPGSDAAPTPASTPSTPSGKGYNDWNCKPLEGRRPVILVHATLFTKESWAIFGPAIAEQGYCVYSLTYGRYWKTLLPMVGAIAPAVDNAKEVGDFAEKVLGATGGKGKIHSMIGLSAINHGTTWQGLAPLLEKLKEMVKFLTLNVDIVTKAAPALQDIMSTSKFIQELNAHGETLPDVFQANIVTKYDEIVSPYKSGFQSGPGVVNVVLQDLCESAYVEHALMVASKTTLRWILNQLDPTTASPANCNPKF